MKFGISRRALLCALPAIASAQVAKQPLRKARPLPSVGEFTRVTDPLTENTIVRLTYPTSASVLPFSRNRFVSSRERILLFSSDRSGQFAPFQLDLRTGAIRQIADAGKLHPRSLSFDRTEKAARYLDGDSLFESTLGRSSPRRLEDGVSSFAGASDGSIFMVCSGNLIRKDGNQRRTLAGSAVDAWPQPSSVGCLFTRSSADTDSLELHYVPADNSSKPALIAGGRVREPFWDADGQSVLFLRDVTLPNGAVVAEIHGRSIAGGPEYLVSPTSQFASFAPNSNATVFVGASRSRAQPNIVLMLRTPRREMTLCEHRSTRPADVSPVFSPDNRRIYFESDHEGRSSIYSVNVELLVEPEV